MQNPYLPREAEIVERIEEAPTIFTLRLRFTDPAAQSAYGYAPGQFNMIYLYGIGEVAISIVSDPEQKDTLDHTIRAVGRVTRALNRLRRGDRIGVRGPYGRGWPLLAAQGRDVALITGGLGCAPLVSVIRYIAARRERFRRLLIMQGVKHSADLIWREQYERWQRLPDTDVLLAADVAGSGWRWHHGPVTALFDRADIDPARTIAFLCGPEPMMLAAIHQLGQRGVADGDIWLSMERNMHCGIGHCGHCMIGAPFVCRNGPVFPFPELKALLGMRGF
ncbi:FAD/NAD(P)-binding protein [Methylocaldum sp.]|uniref:FAD/NAD(P)-binding protein n=1 Tax=Methylocaldum sp. TaxID=1969727 RepID=UPI002D6242F3|nr:FAD/NAD(P)-binding protein [Methylocaldum sp.]HYE35540.1 FAD/NAD(P)-binding protein [Methylocaldum sp.]